MAENKAQEIMTIEEDKRIQQYTEELKALRINGVTKVADCKIQMDAVKKNKLLDDADRARELARLSAELEQAKAVAAQNKEKVDALSKEAVAYVNSVAKGIEAAVVEKQNKRMAGAKAYYEKEVAQIKADGAKRREEVQKAYASADPQELKSELAIADYELKSALYDAKSRFTHQIDQAKAAKNQVFVDHIQKNRELRNGKTKFSEDRVMKWRN